MSSSATWRPTGTGRRSAGSPDCRAARSIPSWPAWNGWAGWSPGGRTSTRAGRADRRAGTTGSPSRVPCRRGGPWPLRAGRDLASLPYRKLRYRRRACHEKEEPEGVGPLRGVGDGAGHRRRPFRDPRPLPRRAGRGDARPRAPGRVAICRRGRRIGLLDARRSDGRRAAAGAGRPPAPRLPHEHPPRVGDDSYAGREALPRLRPVRQGVRPHGYRVRLHLGLSRALEADGTLHDGAGSDADDADAVLPELHPGGSRQHPHAALGDAVGGVAGHRPVLVHRRHVDDDAATALGDELLRRALAAEEGALEVDREHPVVGVLVGVEQGGTRLDAGVVDPHVDAAVCRDRRVDEALQVRDLADVGVDADRLGALVGDLVVNGLGVLWSRHVVHDDLGALSAGDLADRGADAAVASGDDDDLVLEQHAQFSSGAWGESDDWGVAGGGGGAWSRPSGEQMRWATSAVHPVWCEAPSPRPVSPWKYSLNVGCSVHNGPGPWSRGWLGGGPSGPGRKSETSRRCSSSATSARLARWPEPRGSSTVTALPRPSA